MTFLLSYVRATGVSGHLGADLALFIETLDAADAGANQRAWRRLRRTHLEHRRAVAALAEVDTWIAGEPGAEEQRAVRRDAALFVWRFGQLAGARDRRLAVRRAASRARIAALAAAYAAAAMALDARLHETLAEARTLDDAFEW